MLTTPENRSLRGDRRQERRLWHDGHRYEPPLGCAYCPLLETCGGLRLRSSVFDCLNLCCNKPGSCTEVCPNNPDYVDRVREIKGFSLNNVPRTRALSTCRLPPVISLVFHGTGRCNPVALSYAAIPLYNLFKRSDGCLRFASHHELCESFRIAPGTRIILTGTADDRPIERWWGFGEAKRRAIIRNLRELGVVMTTTPNFSLFVDVPRMDNLHAMKRVAVSHWEFVDEGLPAALHVNARTDRDFDRWTNYVAERSEVTHVAYEFTTGTGRATRREQHAEWLSHLAQDVGRPLHIIVRGGTEILPILTESFATVTILETLTFMKTKKRQRAVLNGNVRMGWRSEPTELGAPLDNLFELNRHDVHLWLRNIIGPTRSTDRVSATA